MNRKITEQQLVSTILSYYGYTEAITAHIKADIKKWMNEELEFEIMRMIKSNHRNKELRDIKSCLDPIVSCLLVLKKVDLMETCRAVFNGIAQDEAIALISSKQYLRNCEQDYCYDLIEHSISSTTHRIYQITERLIHLYNTDVFAFKSQFSKIERLNKRSRLISQNNQAEQPQIVSANIINFPTRVS